MSKDKSERRRAERRPILDTFSLFAVVPRKGPYKLRVDDVSSVGIGFFLDIEGESSTEFPVKKGEVFDLNLYLNQSLFLPLNVEVMRVEERDSVRRIGAEFHDKSTEAYKAYLSFLSMLEGMIDVARVG